MYGFCDRYACMVSIMPFGMVWYISKHKHKDNLATFGSVVENLETFECFSIVSGASGSV